MLDQFIEIIKNTTITAVGLMVGLFGVDDVNILNSTDLSDFSQANISESLDSVSEEILDSIPEEIVETDVIEVAMTSASVSDIPVIVEVEEPIIEVKEINPIKISKIKDEIDVSLILNTNFDNFDTSLQIIEIKEDNVNFYVAYQYKTLAIEDRVWELILKNKTLTVVKRVLGDRDLGKYLSEELAEVIDTEIIYLKEVQELQNIKLAKTEETKTTASNYNSLVGRVLDLETANFGDYQPIVKEEVEKVAPISEIVLGDEETELVEEIPAVETETNPVDEIIITDNQAPLLVIQGNNPALIQIGSSYVDLGAKVTDNVSEGLSVEVSGDTVNVDVKGSYFVIYTATDEAGNTATASREVIVYDYGVSSEVEQEIEESPSSQVEEELPIVEEEIVEEIPEIEEVPEVEEEVIEPIQEEETLIEQTKDKVKKIKETVVDVVDDSVDAVQETVSDVVETTVDAVNNSAEAVQETVDAVVETSMEAVTESVENVVEATNEIAEQVSAMILSINIKDLLGNVSSSVDFGLGENINNIVNKITIGVYDNVNNLVYKIRDLVNGAVQGVEYLTGNMLSSVSDSGNQVQKTIGEKIDGASDFVSRSYNKVKETCILVKEKIKNTVYILSDKAYQIVKSLWGNSYDIDIDISKVLSPVTKIFNTLSEKTTNTAQILSSGTYEIIGDIADNFYNTFNFVWKNIKSLSNVKTKALEVFAPVSKMFSTALENVVSVGEKTNNTAQVMSNGANEMFDGVINKISNISNPISSVKTKVSNIFQVMSSSTYEIISGITNKISNIFDLAVNKIKSISGEKEYLTGNIISPISNGKNQITEMVVNSVNGALGFVKNLYFKVEKVSIRLSERISRSLSMAGIKYSNEIVAVEDVDLEPQFLSIEDNKLEEVDSEKENFLKNKITRMKESLKIGFGKTLDFFKKTKPKI